MKKILLFIQILIFSCLFIACSSVEDNVIDVEDEAPKAVNIDLKIAGTMEAYLDGRNLNGVESLTLTGEMNVLDFITLSQMPDLRILDMKDVRIVEYEGEVPQNRKIDKCLDNKITIGFLLDDNQNFEAMSYFSSLTTVELPTSLEIIGVAAFIHCKNLKSITIPNTVHTIEDFAFEGCESLQAVQLPTDYKGSLNMAFLGCKSLETINIPAGISSMQRIFDGCESLSKIELPQGMNYSVLGSMAFVGVWIKEFIFPEDLTYASNFMFQQCPNLEKVVFHKNFIYMDDMSFMDCPKLKSFEFVAPLNTFWYSSMSVGSQLEAIHLKNMTPPLVYHDEYITDSDEVNYSNCTLYVPVGAKAAYEANESRFWTLFKEIVEE